jgi:Cu-Zn family superoxide dismutase
MMIGRLVCANITSESRPPPKLAVAAFKNANITASVVFVQNSDKGLQVLAKFNGLTAGQHGFHIHENPVTTNCDSTGPHFNPGNATHGAWNATTRHLGDLKPLQVDANGTAILSYEDSFARLDGENNIVGRSVVVHALADDLGLGGNENSTKTGNAGGKRSS